MGVQGAHQSPGTACKQLLIPARRSRLAVFTEVSSPYNNNNNNNNTSFISNSTELD